MDGTNNAAVASGNRTIELVLQPGDPPLTLHATRREDGTGWVAMVCVDDPASGHPVPAACLEKAVARLVEDADTGVLGLVDRLRERYAQR